MKKRIAFIFIGLICALIVSEFILRYYHPIAIDSVLHAPYQFSCYKRGTYYWSGFKPNTTCILHSAAGSFPDVPLSFNSLGLRNDPIQLMKPAGTKRILFIGDSFVAGWGVQKNQSLPEQTGTVLRQSLPDTNIETINAGLADSGPGYYYLYLKNDGIQLDPDIIVVGFYIYNDLAENIFESKWVGTDAQGLPLASQSTTSYIDYRGNMRRYDRPIKQVFPLLEQSYLYDLITDQMLRVFPQPAPQSNAIAMYCVFKETCHKLDSVKQKAESLFLGMEKIADLHGKQLVVVLIPAEFQLHPELHLQFGIPIALSPDDITYPHREFGDFFAKNGIRYIDLLPTFQSHASESLYFDLDIHWNNAGNALAAQTIAPYLEDLLQKETKNP